MGTADSDQLSRCFDLAGLLADQERSQVRLGKALTKEVSIKSQNGKIVWLGPVDKLIDP